MQVKVLMDKNVSAGLFSLNRYEDVSNEPNGEFDGKGNEWYTITSEHTNIVALLPTCNGVIKHKVIKR